MSERKVLNKYYPPDFDPNKVPRNKVKKNYTFTIRTMAPFHMRCLTCGEYIYKGRKFNSRHENVPDENYLGLRISRFYIKCPRCAAEIVFKTDIENQDYRMEAGATRCFENLLNARRDEAIKAIKEQEDLEKNPMKMVELKAKSTLLEEEIQGSLKDLEELRTRQRASEILLHAKAAQKEEEDVLQQEEEDLLKQHKQIVTLKAATEKELTYKINKPAKLTLTSVTQPSSSSSHSTAKLMNKLSSGIRVRKKEATSTAASSMSTNADAPGSSSNPLGSLLAYGSDDSNEDETDEIAAKKGKME